MKTRRLIEWLNEEDNWCFNFLIVSPKIKRHDGDNKVNPHPNIVLLSENNFLQNLRNKTEVQKPITSLKILNILNRTLNRESYANDN
jgi:hypothetical protein